jgi:hypothetical protein
MYMTNQARQTSHSSTSEMTPFSEKNSVWNLEQCSSVTLTHISIHQPHLSPRCVYFSPQKDVVISLLSFSLLMWDRMTYWSMWAMPLIGCCQLVVGLWVGVRERAGGEQMKHAQAPLIPHRPFIVCGTPPALHRGVDQGGKGGQGGWTGLHSIPLLRFVCIR